MLFNSPVFLFYFLPVVLCIALLLRRSGTGPLPFILFVTLASLLFYAYTNPAWLPLILGSILVNYAIGAQLCSQSSHRHALLTFGICLNLALLGYFKYADFFIATSNQWLGASWPLLQIALPIGISFYTFQQIAYLVDVHREPRAQSRFVDYLFFVSFFPQLIAGPIVHHKELIPQLAALNSRPLVDDLAVGMTWFFLGLAKKVLLADTFGQHANAFFADPDGPSINAWIGVSAYSLQIYFDFSGYSDMAIGLGRMFGLKLPSNFDSPYKARSIIEFWRRWHITLSRFLKAYLYIPLGGNRNGAARRYLNLLTTMLIGGLWHGAGWGFVVWGGLHGLYLCINHCLQHCFAHRLHIDDDPGANPSNMRLRMLASLRALGWPVTLLAVTLAWVPFRAPDLSTTLRVWESLFVWSTGLEATAADPFTLSYLIAGFGIACYAPNTAQLISYLFAPNQQTSRAPMPAYVRPTAAALAGFAAAIGLALNNRIAEFLYFQF